MKQERTIDQPIKMLIADDHQMVRDGIRVMLDAKRSTIAFDIDEAETGEEALKKASHRPYDIVLIDYHLPGMLGVTCVEEILKKKPGTPILVLSNYDELAYVDKMLTAGAKGYILKNIEPGQLVSAIRTILSGQSYFSNEVAVKLLDLGKKIASPLSKKRHDLSAREIEVLQCIAAELTNDEIASKLFISKRTVDTHRQNVMAKLKTRNTVGLIKAAYELGLLK